LKVLADFKKHNFYSTSEKGIQKKLNYRKRLSQAKGKKKLEERMKGKRKSVRRKEKGRVKRGKNLENERRRRKKKLAC
jgi:hypothetical protein